jgi:hypothetical protein
MEAAEEYRAALDPVAPGEFSVIYGDGVSGEQYQITQSVEDLEHAAAFAQSMGYDGSPSSSEPETRPPRDSRTAPGVKPQTIVGTDNRVNFGISTAYPSSAWPHRAVVRVTTTSMGASSGTLIGKRLVLTSAHGTINSQGIIDWPRIVPRQDTTSPAPPYGVVSAYTYVYPQEWVNLGCFFNSGIWGCEFYDWVVLILWPTPFGSNHPGWMGYASNSDSVVSTWFHYMKGFPGCGGWQSPPSCEWGKMYGDAGDNPTLTDPANPWPFLGRTARLHFRPDSSEGQSGSGVYTYEAGSNGPYVISSVSANAALSGFGGTSPRLTSTTVSYFNTLRASYP